MKSGAPGRAHTQAALKRIGWFVSHFRGRKGKEETREMRNLVTLKYSYHCRYFLLSLISACDDFGFPWRIARVKIVVKGTLHLSRYASSREREAKCIPIPSAASRGTGRTIRHETAMSKYKVPSPLGDNFLCCLVSSDSHQ